jgi:hypothetical protein
LGGRASAHAAGGVLVRIVAEAFSNIIWKGIPGDFMVGAISRSRIPGLLVWAFVLISPAVQGAHFARNVDQSGPLRLVMVIGLLLATDYWLEMDSRRAGVQWVWDMGLFLAIAWPFILTYYLWKTRGVKGILIILAGFGLSVTSFMIGYLSIRTLI